MKMFISWSGERSRAVAEALREWLPYVIHTLEPWVSFQDIEKGSRWEPDLSKQLDETHIGIICVTRENINAPWLLFEAGALAKKLKKALVCTYLLGLKPEELSGPLTQFQATFANKQDTLRLLHTINKANIDKQLTEEQLNKTFEKWWKELEDSLSNIPESDENVMKKMVKDFDAYEIAKGERFELSRLLEPIHDYTDVDRNIEYGAIFAFALEKNPEVLLTFEKYTDIEEISCELVRIGGAEMHVSWKGKEIWKSGPGGGKPDENVSSSYVSFKYNDLLADKPLDYLHEISISPEMTLWGAEPFYIGKLTDKVKIKPDFFEWFGFSMLFWVQITKDFINSNDNKFFFVYTSGAEGEKSYPNGFYFGMRTSKKESFWEFRVIGPDPLQDFEHEKLIKFPITDIMLGWNMFIIRLDGGFRTIKLDILDTDLGNKFVSIDEPIGCEGYPRNVQGHFLELGGWKDSYPGGVSSLYFYKFRIYRGILSDDEISDIFQSERNLVHNFIVF